MGLKITSTGSAPVPFDIIVGSYLSAGAWYKSSRTYTAGPITVSPGVTYCWRGGNRSRTRWENSSGGLISYLDQTTTPSQVIVATAPANASKLYVFYANASGYTFEIARGSSFIPFAYDESGFAVYGPFDLTSIGQYGTSLIDWTSTVPANTSLAVKTAIRNDGITPTSEEYQSATDAQEIPNFTANQDLTTTRLWIKVEMATTDNQIGPEMTDLVFWVRGVGPDDQIQINLTYAGRMKYPVGDVNLNFTGSIFGQGGAFVAPFTLSFVPQNITPIFNPHDPEYISAVDASIVSAIRLLITYSSAEDESDDMHYLTLSDASITNAIRTHIDDIET